MCHVTHMNDSKDRRCAHMNVSWHTYEYSSPVWHTYERHGTHMNVSCHTYVRTYESLKRQVFPLNLLSVCLDASSRVSKDTGHWMNPVGRQACLPTESP